MNSSRPHIVLALSAMKHGRELTTGGGSGVSFTNKKYFVMAYDTQKLRKNTLQNWSMSFYDRSVAEELIIQAEDKLDEIERQLEILDEFSFLFIIQKPSNHGKDS